LFEIIDYFTEKKANELILEDIEGPPKPIEEFTE